MAAAAGLSLGLTVPLQQASALALEYYQDPRWLAIEQRAVFGRSWQLVGRSSDLAAAGDHIVAEVAGVPLLVVRQDDGTLKALHNVCRHRAGPLATCNGRGARRLRCHYHGWTYDLTGQLRVAPEMAEAEGFDAAAIHLPQAQVCAWQGLVFVALDADVPAFADVVAGIEQRIAPIDMRQFQFAKRDVYTVDCNWKVYIDNYLEGYHVPFVHPGLSQVIDYGEYEIEAYPWYALQHAPMRKGADVYGAGTAFYYFLFPNTMLNIVDGRLQTNRVLPVGPDSCIVEFDFYYAASADVQARVAADQAITRDIQMEDAMICTHVQKGLMSGSYVPGRLSPKRELAVHHFQDMLRAVYASQPLT